MGLIKLMKVHHGTIQDRRNDVGANKKEQLALEMHFLRTKNVSNPVCSHSSYRCFLPSM